MFPIRTILHPTDLSERSEGAFRAARSLARQYHARLIVLLTCSPKSGPGGMRVSEALRGRETNHEAAHG